MPETLGALSASPRLYPHRLDLGRGMVSLIEMDETAYRRASFLDERLVSPAAPVRTERLSDVAGAMASSACARPLHFIFHSGHVGSTLLSRLLDELAGVLPLREPLPLRTLAEAQDASTPQLGAHGETFLRLWERGFSSTQTVILKATSSAARLAPQLLALRPKARAVYLNLPPEPYLATLLAGANAEIDLNFHAAERLRRLRGVIGQTAPSLVSLSLGELAAMSWLAERLTQVQVMSQFGVRVLPLDFERLLSAPGETLAAVAAHFALTAPTSHFADVANSPVLTRYSKAPEYSYSPKLRADLLMEARLRHGGEMRKGLRFLEAQAAAHKAVAEALVL